MNSQTSEYRSARTGNVLERRLHQFFWRGRWFSGLVDAKSMALYDDPLDSFAAHVGMASSMAQGLIVTVPKPGE